MIRTGDPDVVILGGGPAGAAASLLLASWGHSVQVITKAGSDHQLAVSLPPSCAKLFDAIGVTAAIEKVDAIRSTGNTVWWGSAARRVEPFAKGALGWQVDLAHLSAALLKQARRAGASAEHHVAAELPTGLVLDCTGRSGVIARARGVRRYDEGPRTIALVGQWRHTGPWPVPDDTHTLIESYDDGWMWSVPVARGTRHIAAMIDPQRSGLARDGSSKHVYLAEIAKTRMFRGLIGGALLEGGPWGWDASPYDATAYAGDNWMLVGDAGSFVDPLSSAGVKKALASGWLAAITAHTCLTDSAMAPHARDFYSQRERDMATQMSLASRRFLADAAAGHHHAFWEERSDDESGGRDDDRMEVARAFEALKSADRLCAAPGPGVTIEPRPCVRGRIIALEPHVVDATLPRGVRYVHNIDMVTLLDEAPRSASVPDLYEAYVQQRGPAPLPEFLLALATAVSRRWLVSE